MTETITSGTCRMPADLRNDVCMGLLLKILLHGRPPSGLRVTREPGVL